MLAFFMLNLLPCVEAAEILKVSQGTLRNWVCAKKIPFKKANGKVLFSVNELQDWLENKADQKQKRVAHSTSKAFDAASFILSACGFEPDMSIMCDKTINFGAILSCKLSRREKRPSVYRCKLI
jgi:excisionase family DNA binding protein